MKLNKFKNMKVFFFFYQSYIADKILIFYLFIFLQYSGRSLFNFPIFGIKSALPDAKLNSKEGFIF